MARLFVLGAALLVFASLSVQAGGKKSDSEVKISAKATKPDQAGKQTLTLTFIHNKDWHTYANPVGNDEFEGNKTVIKVDAKVKPVSVKVDYPKGALSKDNFRIYEDKMDIQVIIQRAQGDTSPLEVSVSVTSCNDKKMICLQPATVKLTVP